MTEGGDSSGLSALYMLRQFAMLRTSSQLFKIAGGMDRLPQAMAAALGDVVRYQSAVVRISRAVGSLSIEYETGGRVDRIAADRVVLTVPLSTLRHIEFRPRLSAAKEKAIAAPPYYPGVRILLQSRDRFWNRAGLNGSARTARAEIWDAAYDRQGPRAACSGQPPAWRSRERPTPRASPLASISSRTLFLRYDRPSKRGSFTSGRRTAGRKARSSRSPRDK